MLDDTNHSPTYSYTTNMLTPSILMTKLQPIQRPSNDGQPQHLPQPQETSMHSNEGTNTTRSTSSTRCHDNTNHAVGDMLALPKQYDITRIYFQNINGTTVTNPSTWETLCTDIQHMDIDISLWAEHNLDIHKPWVQAKLHEATRKTFGLGSYDLQTGSTPIPSQTSYKPGGTLSLVQGPLRGRILERGHDKLGWWNYIKLRQHRPTSDHCSNISSGPS